MYRNTKKERSVRGPCGLVERTAHEFIGRIQPGGVFAVEMHDESFSHENIPPESWTVTHAATPGDDGPRG